MQMQNTDKFYFLKKRSKKGWIEVSFLDEFKAHGSIEFYLNTKGKLRT